MIRLLHTVLFSCTLLPCLIAAQAQAPPDTAALRDAKKILARLSQQHRVAQSLSLKFESRAVGSDGEPMPVVKGYLLTADSGRFRLEHPAGTMVCNGVTLWQYFPNTKQVLVKNASEAGESGGILLRFLEARAVRAEKAGGLLRVVLDPGSVGQNLDSLILTVDPDKPGIRSVETQDPAGSRVEYIVKSLKYGVSVKSKDFVFQAPEGVETVDMR